MWKEADHEMHRKAHPEGSSWGHLVMCSVQTNKILNLPLFFSPLTVCMCVCKCMKVHVSVHACGDQGTTLGIAPQELSTLSFFETGPLTGLEFTKWAG